MAHRFAISAVFLLVCSSLVGAEDKITVRWRDEHLGQTKVVDRTQTRRFLLRSVDSEGKTLLELPEFRETTRQTYTQIVLEVRAGERPTRLRRVYRQALIKDGARIRLLEIHGKTVLIQRQPNGSYRFGTEDGAELEGTSAGILNTEFDTTDDAAKAKELQGLVVPEKPLGVGDTWKIEGAKLGDLLAPFPIDREKGHALGKLVRTYRKDDRQYAFMVWRFEMPLQGELPTRRQKLVLEPGAHSVLHAEQDFCVDGSTVDITREMSMKGEFTAKMKGTDLRFRGSATMTGTYRIREVGTHR